jgi:DNA invertase Pin-like site-specific DNA recombinase
MEKEGGRKLSVEALSERRKTIIRMKKNGCSPMEIVQATGCSRQVIYPIWSRWKSGGGIFEAVELYAAKAGPVCL